MMETYEILLNRFFMDEYIEGRISGVIYVLTGMPEDSGYTYIEDGKDAMMQFDATEGQAKAVAECINKLYPEVYAGIKMAE